MVEILRHYTNKANSAVNPEHCGKMIAKILNEQDQLNQYQCEYSHNAKVWLVTKYELHRGE